MPKPKTASQLAFAQRLLLEEDPKAAREARQRAEEVLKKTQDAHDPDKALEAVFQVITEDLVPEQPLEAIRMAKDKIADFQNSGIKKGEVAMLLAVSLAQLARHEPGPAFESAKKAMALCQKVGDAKWEFRLQAQAAVNICLMTGEKKEALNAANQALALSKRLPDESAKADALFALTQARMANESRDALTTAAEALALYRKVGSKKGEATTLNVMAQAYLERKDAASAIKSSKEALELFRAIDATKGAVESLNLTVEAQILNGDAKEALKTVEDALSKFRAKGDRQGEASASLTLFLAHRSQEDQDTHANEALEVAADTLTLFRELGDRKGEADMWLKVAETHLAWGMLEETMQEAQEALMTYRDLKDRKGEDNANIVLSQVYMRKGEPALAPLHGEGLELLSRVARAIDARDGPAYRAANERLMAIGGYGLITQTEQASLLGPSISQDSTAALEFINANALEGQEVEEVGAAATGPQSIWPQQKGITYLNFRFSGIAYGPRFRCVDWGSRMKTAAGEENETLGFSVLQLQDMSDDWEYALKLHPAILDCALQSGAVLGELALPRKTEKGEKK